ncbi:hypothetical protein PGT21_013982 [Puccinia graminis f. sp. tritici]|uniref:Uncharacterized protein n=1 Tax=Puccinia graminis f. sp. tritici TaxID=56615 RepID=A0A5B0MWP4_PUCGR|nr:hypothetical protein PGT21_013982 [Puccinia graminis f. sp. tritici]
MCSADTLQKCTRINQIEGDIIPPDNNRPINPRSIDSRGSLAQSERREERSRL